MIYFVGSDEYGEPIRVFYATEDEFPALLDEMKEGNPKELCLLATLPGGQLVEAVFHEKYRTDHIREHWFHGERIRRDCLRGEVEAEV